jgi:hypothetical protein
VGEIGLYRDMLVAEDFERCAQRLFKTLQFAAQNYPNQPRILYLEIQGHQNELEGFDRDAWEIIGFFVPEFLAPYLTEIHTPLYSIKNPGPQREDVPEELIIYPPPDGSNEFDVHLLSPRSRESGSTARKSRPSVKAIADYLGMDEPCCLICWQTPIERAHALPKALGGSYDVRNYALLCPRHHQQAPDVSDAEAFWAWVDYVTIRDGHEKWTNLPKDLQKQLNIRIPETGLARDHADFSDMIHRELVELYGWQERDFATMTWELQSEFQRLLSEATSDHFGVKRKSSTYAWAYDKARKRLNYNDPSSLGPSLRGGLTPCL